MIRVCAVFGWIGGEWREKYAEWCPRCTGWPDVKTTPKGAAFAP